MRRLPQSTAYTVMLKVFQSSDHTTKATGATVAITISKNGGAFGNPNAGATNATEVSNGWYKVTLDTTDTGTLGDLVVRGTATGCDDSEQLMQVVKATNGGLTALPDAAAEASGGLFTRGTGAGQINQDGNGRIDTNAVRIDGSAFSTHAAGMVPADLRDIAGSAVSASTAQLGVNVVNFGGSAGTFAAGIPDVNVAKVAGTSQTAKDLGATLGTPAGVSIAADIAGVQADTDNIQTRLPAALVSGRMDSSIGAVASGAIGAAGFASGAFDAVWTVTTRLLTAGTNIVLAKGTGITGFNDLSAAQVNAEADTALADVGVTATVTGRIDAAISTRLAGSSYSAPLDAAGTRSAVGLASANLDTQLGAISAKTTNLPADPADASDIASAFGTVNSTLSTIAGYVDTEVAAIKAKTDNLPADPADASDIAAAFTTVNSTLATIASYVDTEVAAIKAKTDNLPSNPAASSDIPSADSVADALLDRADAIETGLTLRKAMRLVTAVLGGVLSGAGTTTETMKNAVANSKTRVTATVDANGNRSSISTDLT